MMGTTIKGTPTMKLHILSDLHNEFSTFVPPDTDADVVVLAGDIGVGTTGMTWAKQYVDKPTIYLAGNHEYYNGNIESDLVRFRAAAVELGIHFLDCTTLVLGGVRFIGATMWTDFRLGTRSDQEVAMAMKAAHRALNDFKAIEIGKRRFQPPDAVALFEQAVAFIASELAKPFDGKTVVVTHHSPSPQSVHPRYIGDAINGAFSSDLEYLMQAPNAPALWIHGHTHDSFDYVVDGCTRVVANPRGYTSRYGASGQENEFFNPGLIIEV